MQGMVAVEAARQMFLAVIERYFTARWPQQRYYIVLNSMNTTFSNFLFPVGAILRLTLDESDLSEPSLASPFVRRWKWSRRGVLPPG